MTLGAQILILAVCMSLFCALPLFSPVVRRYAGPLFLVGTGAMLGICFFDLVPGIMNLGGRFTLILMGVVWLSYSAIHFIHLTRHEHDPLAVPGKGFWFFFGPLVAHGFASGMLLTVSQELSSVIETSVFVALIVHKIYESLLLSSILIAQRRSSSWKLTMVAIYTAALPAGAIITRGFESEINRATAVVISSVAVGTLLGCLVFDFLIPSFRQLRAHKYRVGWVVAGLLLTRVVMGLSL